MSEVYHPDGVQIVRRLRDRGLTYLYHFTSVRNLGGIRRAGELCSKRILRERGLWTMVEPGGNELSQVLDEQRNSDIVCLSFSPHFPMVYRRTQEGRHFCWLAFDIEVAALRQVQFTDTNSTSSYHRRGSGLSALDWVDLDAVLDDGPVDPDRRQRYCQAEVLVTGALSLKFLREVGFISVGSMWEGERQWGRDEQRPHFRVQREWFSGGNYPYLDRLYLTDQFQPDQLGCVERLARVSVRRDEFKRSSGGYITVIAHLGGEQPSIQTKVIVAPTGQSFSQTIPPNATIAPMQLSMQNLPNKCSILYYIRQSIWAKVTLR